MHINRDMYGEYKECLQCGQMIDIEKRAFNLDPSMTGASKKKRKVA